MILKRTLAFATIVVMSVLSSVAYAQTDAFPQNEGGFEAGTTFAANGWTEVNANNNKWYVGTFTKFTGLRGAYIDRNNTAGTQMAMCLIQILLHLTSTETSLFLRGQQMLRLHIDGGAMEKWDMIT